jgi:CubicO group peptidase (beta-lactamase class C family)
MVASPTPTTAQPTRTRQPELPSEEESQDAPSDGEVDGKLAFISLGGLAWSSETPEEASRFAEQIELLRRDSNIPGMSVAVLWGQEIVLAQGFGYADLVKGEPATENTPYHIASLTKPFAAAIIMQLAERGQLDLDAMMADIWYDVPFQMSGSTIYGYTSLCEKIKGMGNDTSEANVKFRYFFQDYRCDTEPITVWHHLTHTSQGASGAQYLYNAFLFGLLTQVMEQVTGRSFDELLVDRIIGPLDMSSTVPNASKERWYEVLELRAKPYRIDENGSPVLSDYPQGRNAAAGIVSTVLDLARFDVAMDRNLIVTQESKQAMFSPARSNDGDPLPYGLGWFIQEYEGIKLVWHYGYQITSYSSLILKIPEKDLTLILLANSDGASALYNLHLGDVLASPFAATFIDLFTDI